VADNGFKNNAGHIEWYDNDALVFSIWDDASGLYMIAENGRLYVKKISDDSIVATLWEEG
jgi:hypothetical protein